MPGHRRPQTHRRARATGPRYGRRRRLGNERSRRAIAVAFHALQPAGKRAGTRLAVVGNGTALPLLTRRTGAPFRPQRELGFAPPGAGRSVAGSGPTTRARRQDRRASGDEASGAGGARRCERLPASGHHPHRTTLRFTRRPATLCGLAQRRAHRSRPHPRRAGVVPRNATPASAGGNPGSGTSGTRSGNGARHPAPREQAAQRSATRDEPRTTKADAVQHRSRAPRTESNGRKNPKRTGAPTTC